jgi:hypothetical protein
MSYELRESGKPPKYNVLLNEPPNGNNPLKNKTNSLKNFNEIIEYT